MRGLCFILVVSLAAIADARIVKDFRRTIDEDCPLCDYVYEDDGFYDFFLYDHEVQDGCDTYYLNLTSQKWFDESWTDYPVWTHHLTIHVPQGQRRLESAALIYIGSRSRDSTPPDSESSHIYETGEICKKHRIVTASIRQIPNQPLIFTDDPDQKERTEDDMLAYTWRQFLDDEIAEEGSADPHILARNPMCKGSVRAMDAITDFVKELDDTDVTEFVVAGQSKRGWTTWIVGAIDSRVVGMVPTVLTCLNLVENFHHYYQSFGGWPYYFFDYWNKQITAFMDHPAMQTMADIIDPYVYRDWMTMPKLVVSGSSDEFFLIDDYKYFFHDLPGESSMWLMDNTGHSPSSGPYETDYWRMVGLFSESVFENTTRPHFTWTLEVDSDAQQGTINVDIPDDQPVLDVIAYWADSVVPDRRDWRNTMLSGPLLPPPVGGGELPSGGDTGIIWQTTAVTDLGSGQYTVTMDFPDEGYIGFFVRVRFAIGGGEDWIVSTEANIIPDHFPYERCEQAECLGYMI